MYSERLPQKGWINHDFIQIFEDTYPHERVIYHYTNPDGMIGILGNSKLKLRFSRITCLNDYSEGLEVVPLYKSVCTDLMKQHLISEEYYEELLYISPQLIRNFADKDGNELSCDNDVYVCCFSKIEDSLSMWNYYLHNEKYLGYSIGIKSSTFKGVWSHEYGRIELVSVIYDDDEKRQLIRDAVLDCYYNGMEPGTMKGGDERQISALLTCWKYAFKSHHSKNEQEVRALLFFPHSTDPNLNPLFLTNDDIKFRTKNGIIIPYIEVEFEKDIFDSICIAPNPRLQDASNITNQIEYEMLDEYLKRNQYHANKISISTVPARY